MYMNQIDRWSWRKGRLLSGACLFVLDGRGESRWRSGNLTVMMQADFVPRLDGRIESR